MKKLLLFFALITVAITSIAQSESHNFITYDTTINFGSEKWIVRISRPTDMFTVGNADTASRPAIITMPGQGEQGSVTFSKLQVYGPHYWLNNGWDGGVVLGNGTHYPILITNIYTNNVYPSAPSYYTLLSYELSTYHIKLNSVHLGGLSQGAFTEGALILFEQTAGAETGMKLVTSIVALEGTPDPLPGAYQTWNRMQTAYKVWAKKYGGKYFYLEGNGSDNFRDGWQWSKPMNDTVPGSAYFSYENLGGGSHCCWNSMYDPNATNWTSVGTLGPNNAPSQAGTNTMGTYKAPSSIFQWMLRQGDTTMVGSNPLSADAGSDQSLSSSATSTSVTGSSNTPAGTTITSTVWTSISGPNTPVIGTPNSPTTSITGLVAGTYVFRFTVTNSASASTFSQLNITVAPVVVGALHIVKPVVAEYRVWYIKSDSTIHAFNNGSRNIVQFPIGGRKVVDAVGGFNVFRVIDDQGFIWASKTDGTVNTTRYDTDTTGSAFDNNIFVDAYANTVVTIRSDSSVWYFGNDSYNMFYTGGQLAALATGAFMKPTQLSPAGMKFKKVLLGGNRILGLTTTGQVYVWPANPSTGGTHVPTLLSTPRAAIDIFVSHLDLAGCIIPDAPGTGSQTMGYPYVFGTTTSMYGGSTAFTNPTSIKALWGLTVPIKEISLNWNTIHFIDSLSRLWGCGFNPMGEVGIGVDNVNQYYYPGFPGYGWNFTDYTYPTGIPVQMGAGVTWKKLYTNNWFAFFTYAQDVNDSLYFCGRDKSLVSGRGFKNLQDASSYNVLDVLTFTQVHPSTSIYQTYNFSAPTIDVGANQNISGTSTILNVTSSPVLLVKSGAVAANGIDTACCKVVSYLWTQLSGNSSVITAPTSQSTSVTGLSTGVYKYVVKVTDNNTGTITDTIQVSVATSQPTANAGINQIITLPVNSTTLIGSGVAGGGSSITGYGWVKTSGPTGGTITSPSSATTSITGLIQGTYVYTLTVTQTGGATATSSVTITVNAANPIGCLLFNNAKLY